jgi:hypothetical protein
MRPEAAFEQDLDGDAAVWRRPRPVLRRLPVLAIRLPHQSLEALRWRSRRSPFQSFEPPLTGMMSPVIQRASLGYQEGDDAADVVRLSEALLQRLHTQGVAPSALLPGEVGHVRLRVAGRDRVDSYPAVAERPSFRLRVSKNIFGATARTLFARTAWPRTVMARRRASMSPGCTVSDLTLSDGGQISFSIIAQSLTCELSAFFGRCSSLYLWRSSWDRPDREALFTAVDPVIDQERSRAHCMASCRSEDAHPEPGQVRIPVCRGAGSGSRLLLQPSVGYFKSHDVKSFDPHRSLRSHFVSVAKRCFTVTGCHKYPFDAGKSR